MDEHDERAVEERSALTGLAYRMLGSVAEAEDAVQEAYVRWWRQQPADRARIENPGAWLMRTLSRICLDVLGSARVRREAYVGPWLPEPLPAEGADPLDRITLDDSVSMALQVVLDALSPAERVAFVLHDVFAVPFAQIADATGRSTDAARQLAASARRKVRDRRGELAPRERHDEIARAFAAACLGGDLGALVAILDPSVTLVSDGGGRVSSARRPVHGADNVARFLLGLVRKRPRARVAPAFTADGMGFVVREDGRVDGVIVLGVSRAGSITEVWFVRNPDKLARWR
ncbi:RNA polymerase sigma factor SigJ [Microbacterium sp. SORGH_AS_0888]|uniref:RNA polymerase sigma factor SigJ n=1 Tax=Microbacterium sp. SORGH_AS_0888 TaxID=3041791 RepID=UPI00277F90D3|nr:RNA polymerase sigma factor SigJ [Microbacterium sp. SORGH_AS_0888]MDQ1130596.1 RNA polymerase sigma-70 factor (ECF subfamily) [Microbacterium sp. SORGH_AS_0888]